MSEALSLKPRTGFQPLSTQDFEAAAAALGCEARSIKAVVEVESPRGAFDEQGRPSLLFERHKFHRRTKGRFDMVAPDLSCAVPGGYGKYSEQFDRLSRAYALAPEEALLSTSFGAFQILGENFLAAGYRTVREFADAMCQSEGEQLAAFVRFIATNRALHRALNQKDWVQFARLYNGPTYSLNHYDEKIAAAYLEEK